MQGQARRRVAASPGRDLDPYTPPHAPTRGFLRRRNEMTATAPRVRRPPPPFRSVEITRVESVTPWLQRVTLGGEAFEGFTADEPAASVRLLIPRPGATELVVPTWRGNEFLLPDDTKPTIRTFTPRAFDSVALELDVDVVIHGRGPASDWAAAAGSGMPAAVSGPGRGYTVDADACYFVIAGDESAIPAVRQVVDALPVNAAAQVFIEVGRPDARTHISDRANSAITWLDLVDDAPPGSQLVAAMQEAPLDADMRIWAAGEAASMQRIRRHCFETVGITRAHCTIRGYWKHGRSGDTDG